MQNKLGYLLVGAVAGLALATLCARRMGGAARPEDHIRVAGRKEMTDPPQHWDMTDERSDESFPASDPPGTY